ncbi:hypothetical protein F5884DRAFT_758567 [Xylogone sp. PMI_703]|nr:hypothetical protein F5884DRAFT_758567 [Xylogone sp. PMI_703]
MKSSVFSYLLLPLIAKLAYATNTCSSSPPHALAIHHSVVAVTDIDKSLSFYHEGIGLDILNDVEDVGDWKTLFGSNYKTFHGVFLEGPKVSVKHPQSGLFLISFWVGDALNATLARLHSLGFGGVPKIATFGTPPATYATVRDPDGTQVLLVSNSYVNSVGEEFP